jgi:hypothetical protein
MLSVVYAVSFMLSVTFYSFMQYVVMLSVSMLTVVAHLSRLLPYPQIYGKAEKASLMFKVRWATLDFELPPCRKEDKHSNLFVPGVSDKVSTTAVNVIKHFLSPTSG